MVSPVPVTCEASGMLDASMVVDDPQHCTDKQPRPPSLILNLAFEVLEVSK